jgi:hypothetical protein
MGKSTNRTLTTGLENQHWCSAYKEQGAKWLIVRCSIWDPRVTGPPPPPLFFKGTAKAESYLNMLGRCSMSALNERGDRPKWFMQDGALHIMHFPSVTGWMNISKIDAAVDEDRWNGYQDHRTWIPWISLSVVIWNHVLTEWRSLMWNIQQRIRAEVASIIPAMLKHILNNINLRLKTCFDYHGRRFQQIM